MTMTVLHNDPKPPLSSISSLVLRDPIPTMPDLPNPHQELAEALEATSHLSGAERTKAVKRLMLKKRAAALAEIARHEAEYTKKRANIDRLKTLADGYKDLAEWAASGLKLERPEVSEFRNFRRAVGCGEALHLVLNDECEFPSTDYEKEYLRHAEVFVVEHDWASAFDRAAEISDAPFRLPYEVCAFEFQISGRRVIGLAAEIDERVTFTPAAWSSKGWLIPGFVYWLDGALWISTQKQLSVEDTFDKVVELVGKQIRAVCIALDAEVATTRTERAPHTSHASRQTAPPKPYHIVSLARRERAPALESVESGGHKRRLHFRRGHWRHYENHKTWIKWMLVGNPELGFIDKHYTL